jgi:two-component system, sensor histidine kinase PdtaS
MNFEIKTKILSTFLVVFFVKLTLAYNVNIQQLKSEYEEKFEKTPSFYTLEKLIEIYLIDSKYKDAENLLINFDLTNLSSENLADYYLLLAKTYKYQIKNDLAILNYNTCSKFLYKINSKEKIINYTIELLEFYRKTADFDRAFKLIDELIYSYNIESIKNDTILNFFYNRYAAVLNERSRGKESIPISLKAIELAKKINNIYAEAISYNELGFTYKNMLNNKKSIEYYEKAYKLWMHIGCFRDAIHAKYNKNIVISHNELLPYIEQIKSNKNLIKLIDSLKVDYPTSPIFTLIEFHLVNLKKWELAYLYRVKSDSAALEEQKNANYKILNDLKEKYENEQLNERNKSIKKLALERKEKLKLAETRFWWIFLFSTFTILLSLILFILWRKNKIQNKKLIEQNKQKTYLIQEIHHRVKNNLQFVKSILTFQESLNELTANETIEDINRRIDAMSMVHEMLYSDNESLELSIKEYVERLLTISHSLYNSKKELKFKIEIDEIFLPLEQLVAIGVIISELLANSAKHVFNKTEHPEFFVKIKKQDDFLFAIISDNGVESEFQRHDKRFKLGMKLIEIFIKQLNAEMILNNTIGYKMSFKFKLTSL